MHVFNVLKLLLKVILLLIGFGFASFICMYFDPKFRKENDTDKRNYQQDTCSESFMDEGNHTIKIKDAGNEDDFFHREPCQNGGILKWKGEKDHECQCIEGFTGKNCEYVKWCKENKEVCGSEECVDNENTGFGFCFCKDGFYFDAQNTKCRELDKCLFQRIRGNCSMDHETCDRITGKCICEENYTYNDNQTACKLDFCGRHSNKSLCGVNMECIEDETFSCVCKQGFRPFGKICVKINKCAPGVSNCQQRCLNGRCSCFPGFKINADGYSCDPEKSTLMYNADYGPGICIKEGTNEKCFCPEISHILKGNICIDKCAAGKLRLGECPAEMGCISAGESGYRCNCTGKYEFSEEGVHCKVRHMCSEGGGNEACALKGGYCEDDFGKPEGYTCQCKFGYEKVLHTDECRDMCEALNCGIKQALCVISVENKPKCVCPPLLVESSNGKCDQLARYSYIGDILIPKANYQLKPTVKDSGSRKSDIFKDLNYAKLLKDFEDSMTNIFDGFNGATLLNCTDEEDDLKCSLEIKLNVNPKERVNIVMTSTICLPLPDGRHCLIPPKLEVKKKITDTQLFKKTDPCDRRVSGKLCGSETECIVTETAFKCKCKSGYFQKITYAPVQNVEIDVCEDEDECLDPTICPNTTTCSNLHGDYTCKCKDGHRSEEGKCVKTYGCRAVCDPNPCFHGRCVVKGTDEFLCYCHGIYTGPLCEKIIDGYKLLVSFGELIKKYLFQTIMVIVIPVLKKFKSQIIGLIKSGKMFLYMKLLAFSSLILQVVFNFCRSNSIKNTGKYESQIESELISETGELSLRQPGNDDRETTNKERENEQSPHCETGNQWNQGTGNSRMMLSMSMPVPRPQLEQSTDKGFKIEHMTCPNDAEVVTTLWNELMILKSINNHLWERSQKIEEDQKLLKITLEQIK